MAADAGSRSGPNSSLRGPQPPTGARLEPIQRPRHGVAGHQIPLASELAVMLDQLRLDGSGLSPASLRPRSKSCHAGTTSAFITSTLQEVADRQRIGKATLDEALRASSIGFNSL